MALVDFARAIRPTSKTLTATLAAVTSLALAACSDNATSSTTAKVDVNPYVEDIVMGSEDAPITIVEFASLSCSHCRDFWKQDFPRLQETYIETGKVKYILKDFPTPPQEIAVAGAGIARCAGADNYYKVVDDVFSNYHEIMEAAQSSAGALPVLVAIGNRAGLTTDETMACIDNAEVKDYVQGVIDEARELGITSTPTIYINDEKMDKHRFDDLSVKIESILNPDATAETTEAEPTE